MPEEATHRQKWHKMRVSVLRRVVILIVLSTAFMIYLNFRVIPNENTSSLHKKHNLFEINNLLNERKPINIVNTNSRFGIKPHFSKLPPTPKRTVTTTKVNFRKRKSSKIIKELKNNSTKIKIHSFEEVTEFRSNWEKVPYSHGKQVEMFDTWKNERDVVCEGKVSMYNDNFLYTTSMLLDRTKAKSSNLGGEDIQAVILQDENTEYYEYEIGFMLTKCLKRFSYFFENTNHLNQWLTNTLTKSPSWSPQYINQEFTIAIVRYEYANLFHTFTDWYNAFLIKEFFNKTSFQTNILIVDTHPQGMLDTVWSHLFNQTSRLSNLPNTTLFTDLAWGILGYNSPLKITWSNYKLPLVEEFRIFFLNAFNISHQRRINCKKLKILIIWRRDYLAHPRNPNGTVSRKIANEAALVKYLRNTLPAGKFVIMASQIDRFSMSTQLQMVAWADVFVGMHGAGLTHAMFLSPSSALIELQPNYYEGTHFEAIAKWRGLVYTQWRNTDPLNELPNQSTIIPPQILLTLIKKTSKALCSTQQ